MNDEDAILFKAPNLELPELRLYYDEQGRVLFYTCDKPDGNFIKVDSQTFAAARMDLKIVDGAISTKPLYNIVSKLMPSITEGVTCVEDDVSIIADSNYVGNKKQWRVNVYEL